MFGRLHDSFFDDPFFGMPQDHHLRRMDDLMYNPLGSDTFLAIADGSDRHGSDHRRSDSNQLIAECRRGDGEYDRPSHDVMRPSRDVMRPSRDVMGPSHDVMRTSRDMMRSEDSMFGNPFGFMSSMMSNMNRMMEGVHRQMGQVDRGDYSGDGHFYSQSTVMSYSKAGDGQPKIYQATKLTRQAPGGIRETHKAVRDTEAGIEKMSVGRHIKDRGHVITRERASKTGQFNENQDFLNIDESEAPAFDSEWKQRTSESRDALPDRHAGRHHAGHDNHNRSVRAMEYPEDAPTREPPRMHSKKK